MAGTGRQGLRPSRRAVLAAAPAIAWVAPPARAQSAALTLSGRLQQGGFALGQTEPRALVLVDDQPVGQASARGVFVVGFDRDGQPQTKIAVRTARAEEAQTVSVAPGQWDIQRIDGLPQDQVTPQDPVLLARIAEEAKRKAIGFASDIDSDDFRAGFALPVQGARLSARFGGQRILNGAPERPHYGSDLAAPIGTPVTAPADGVVTFAETGLHYEGGLILIDHGQGLITAYLHLSSVEVLAGQAVSRGERIGAVGKEGRATGPHLCWRMKWRGRNLDPMLMLAPGAA